MNKNIIARGSSLVFGFLLAAGIACSLTPVPPTSTPTPVSVTIDGLSQYSNSNREVEVQGYLCLPDRLRCLGTGFGGFPYRCELPLFHSSACEGAHVRLEFRVLDVGKVEPNAMRAIYIRIPPPGGGGYVYDQEDILIYDDDSQMVTIGNHIRVIGRVGLDEDGLLIQIIRIMLVK